jgi:hypothetical protein
VDSFNSVLSLRYFELTVKLLTVHKEVLLRLSRRETTHEGVVSLGGLYRVATTTTTTTATTTATITTTTTTTTTTTNNNNNNNKTCELKEISVQ